MASEAISEYLILKKFSWGAMPPDPPTLFTFTPTQWLYQSEIAGAGPALVCVCVCVCVCVQHIARGGGGGGGASYSADFFAMITTAVWVNCYNNISSIRHK